MISFNKNIPAFPNFYCLSWENQGRFVILANIELQEMFYKMKKSYSFVIIMFLAALLTTSADGQQQRSKEELLKEIAAMSNSSAAADKEKAYQTSKEFLARFGTEKNDIIKKVRKYVETYRTTMFFKAVDGNNFQNAFTLGKEILADEPGNADVLLNLTYAGYNSMAAGDKTYADDTISSARKASEVIEAGTNPKSFAPFKDRTDALAWSYYIEGTLVTTRDKKAGAASIYKATLLDSPIKENALPYNMIALYYEEEYTKLASALKGKMAAKPVNETEAAALEARLKQALELMLDAYARSSKKADAENAANKAALKNRLAEVYKFVKKTDEGLSEYVNYTTKTPLPDPGKF